MKNIQQEAEVIKKTSKPNTIESLKHDLKTLGLKAGMVVIMHSSLSKLGWTAGGPVSVIKAMMDVLTPDGTLVMPTFTGANTDPANWQNPPVPPEWCETIRENTPAFNPEISPTRGMGIIAETFRKWPKVVRSNHPVSSFAAWGKHAKFITDNHELEADLGESSPLSRIYDLNGYILLLGVPHLNNTSIHLAEYRSDYLNKQFNRNGSAMMVENSRVWVEWNEIDHDVDDFNDIGRDFEQSIQYLPKKVGIGESRLLSQCEMVDFAIKWMEKNRN